MGLNNRSFLVICLFVSVTGSYNIMEMVPYLTGMTSNIYDADELPWNAAYPHVPVLGLSSVSQQLPITTTTNIQHPSSKPVRALKLPEPDKKCASPAVNTAPIIKTQLAAVSVGFEVTPVAARKNPDRPTGRVNKFAECPIRVLWLIMPLRKTWFRLLTWDTWGGVSRSPCRRVVDTEWISFYFLDFPLAKRLDLKFKVDCGFPLIFLIFLWQNDFT